MNQCKYTYVLEFMSIGGRGGGGGQEGKFALSAENKQLGNGWVCTHVTLPTIQLFKRSVVRGAM